MCSQVISDQGSYSNTVIADQLTILVDQNNQLKVDNLVLKKQLKQLRKKVKFNKGSYSPEKLTKDSLAKQELVAQNKLLQEKFYQLNLKHEQLENEHNLLKLNNQFHQKAILDLEELNRRNFSSVAQPSSSNNEESSVIANKGKIERLENKCRNYE